MEIGEASITQHANAIDVNYEAYCQQSFSREISEAHQVQSHLHLQMERFK